MRIISVVRRVAASIRSIRLFIFVVGPASDETYRVHVLIGMRPPTTSPLYCYDAKPEANPNIPIKSRQLECIVSPTKHSCIVHQRIAMNRRCSHPKHHPPDSPDEHTLDGSTRIWLIRCTRRATHGWRGLCRCVCTSRKEHFFFFFFWGGYHSMSKYGYKSTENHFTIFSWTQPISLQIAIRQVFFCDLNGTNEQSHSRTTLDEAISIFFSVPVCFAKRFRYPFYVRFENVCVFFCPLPDE